MSTTIKIKPWGNSQGIMLSKKLLSSIGIEEPKDQEVTVNVEDNRLIIKKKTDQSRLMKNYGYLMNEPNIGELDWGEDVGNEFLD